MKQHSALVGPFVALLFLVVSFETASAQGAGPARHSLEPGAWALQVGVGSDFTLQPFQGGFISAKHHYRSDRALRYGLSASGTLTDVRDTISEPDVPADREFSREESRLGLGLSTQYVVYPGLAERPERSLQLFYGAGPSVRFSYGRVADTSGDSLVTMIRDARERTYTFGADGVIGGEWFVRQDLSLSAEYRVQVGYQILRRRTEMRDEYGGAVPAEEQESRTRGSSWFVSAGTVILGISLYF